MTNHEEVQQVSKLVLAQVNAIIALETCTTQGIKHNDLRDWKLAVGKCHSAGSHHIPCFHQLYSCLSSRALKQ